MKNIFQILEKRRWFVFWALTFFFLQGWSYINFVSLNYGYAGFVFDPKVIKILEGVLFYFILILLSPKKLEKPSDLFISIVLFSSITPVIVFYSLSDASRLTFYISILALFIINAASSGRLIRFPLVRNGTKAAIVILWTMLLVTFALLIAKGGLQRLNFDVSRVYEFRQSANDDFYSGALGYLLNWSFKVAGPMLFAIVLLKKNYFVAALVFGLHLVFFGITSHKGVAFAPLALFLVWLGFRSNKALSIVPLGLSLVIIFSMSLAWLLNENTLASLLIRRIFYVPASLIFSYHEFFSHNGPIYWANSITSGFLSYPYDINPAKLIGRYRGTTANANAGFIATGYMHAGNIGVIFYAIIIGVLFRVIDSLSYRKYSPLLTCLVLLIPVATFTLTSDLPTTLLTHGGGFALLIMYLYSSPGVEFRKPKTL